MHAYRKGRLDVESPVLGNFSLWQKWNNVKITLPVPLWSAHGKRVPSNIEDFLRDLLENKDGKGLLVLPEGKRKEMQAFIDGGLLDVPVTRPKYKLSWGIEAPNDPEHVLYVWFDALINYYTVGSQNGFWDEDTEIVHFVGKDIARWHTLLWPAMLKSAGMRLPDTVYVHGFINLNGEKISKSKGNVIYPNELVEKYGVDAVRYYFLKHGPVTEDADISIEHFESVYNGELANGLGNTVARLAKLGERAGLVLDSGKDFADLEYGDVFEPIESGFRTDLTLVRIWEKLGELDKQINQAEPWKITDAGKLEEVLTDEIGKLVEITTLLQPFIPNTAKKILEQFDGNVKSGDALFPRLKKSTG
jgi:methionyl-tRNA synthetase